MSPSVLTDLTAADTSHILVLATTILLRCIAETTTNNTRRECVKSLSNLMNCLDVGSRDSEWELADLCLERYRGIVQAIVDSLSSSTTEPNSTSEVNLNGA